MKVQLNFQLSQGSAATNVRESGKFYSSFLFGLSGNTTVKELLTLYCTNRPRDRSHFFPLKLNYCNLHSYRQLTLQMIKHVKMKYTGSENLTNSLC